jgi:DNA-binding IclR family transcriptional regulator
MPTRRSVLPNVLLKRAPKPTAQRARSGINSGLDLLECLAAQERPLTLTEIALAVGMAKSSVHQLLLSLVARGYAQRLPDQRYSIGIKPWEIGRVAEPHMAALVRKVSEGAALAVLDGRHTVCIQIAESRQAVRVHRRVGERNPAHVVSNGLALLSTLGDDEIVALLPEKLEQPTARTLGTRDEVLAELRRVRQRGFAVCRGSWQLDVAGVAVPVRGADHRAAAAVAIALPLDRLTAARLQEFAAALGEAASAIERQLGGPALTLPGLAPTPRLERRA